MLSWAPESLATSTAWRIASPAVSEPSVPTTMRVNTPPPLLGRRTGRILTPRLAVGRKPAKAVADDLRGRGREANDRDRDRGEEAGEEDRHPDFPQSWHRLIPSWRRSPPESGCCGATCGSR